MTKIIMSWFMQFVGSFFIFKQKGERNEISNCATLKYIVITEIINIYISFIKIKSKK